VTTDYPDGANYIKQGIINPAYLLSGAPKIKDWCTDTKILNELVCRAGRPALLPPVDCSVTVSGGFCTEGACVTRADATESEETEGTEAQPLTPEAPAGTDTDVLTCTDSESSDGSPESKNFFTFGTIKLSDGRGFVDMCEPNGLLTERFCYADGKPGVIMQNCTELGAYVCKSGACVPKCTDSDSPENKPEGKNYLTFGTITLSDGRRFVDMCEPNGLLTERFCYADGKPGVIMQSCTELGAYVCKSGACTQS
jgi:hypothetical protein